jgi:hypothetical protein
MSRRSPKMNRIRVISFVFLATLAAAPCSAQKAQAPLPAAAAQSKKQDQKPQFTHAEVVQFVHTLQIQAAGWKDTINSVDPSAFHLNEKGTASVEKEKKALLLALDEIGMLSLPTSEKNAATDLVAEFAVYTFLSDIGYGAESLGDLSYNSIDSVAKAGELLQVQREALRANSSLFKEIGNRLVNIALSEKSSGCQ